MVVKIKNSNNVNEMRLHRFEDRYFIIKFIDNNNNFIELEYLVEVIDQQYRKIKIKNITNNLRENYYVRVSSKCTDG